MYSLDLRSKAIKYYLTSKQSLRTVGKIFGVGKSSLCRWLNRIEIKKREKKKPNLEVIEFISKEISNGWFERIKDLQNKIKTELKMELSMSRIRRIIKGLNFSYKRMRRKVLMKRNSKEIKLEFKRKVREIGFENTLCFDEVGFQLEMNPRYGWSKKGKRCTMIKKKGGIQEVL